MSPPEPLGSYTSCTSGEGMYGRSQGLVAKHLFSVCFTSCSWISLLGPSGKCTTSPASPAWLPSRSGWTLRQVHKHGKDG